jgi:transketolase N-terminal domain/subunit
MKTQKNLELKKRILEISYKMGLTHIGSCLSCVNAIDAIYQRKLPSEKFILSNGHAGLALYVVLEKYYGVNAETLVTECGTHPTRIVGNSYIDCSTGSLGHGLGIAVGMALADRTKSVFCCISDGECSEGSIVESLRVANERDIKNIYIALCTNGYGAYKKIDIPTLVTQLYAFVGQNIGFAIYQDVCNYTGLQGLEGHYKGINKREYEAILEEISNLEEMEQEMDENI